MGAYLSVCVVADVSRRVRSRQDHVAILERQERVERLIAVAVAALVALDARHRVHFSQAEKIGKFPVAVVDGVEEAEHLLCRSAMESDDERLLHRLRVELHKVEHNGDLHIIVSAVVHGHEELVLASVLDSASGNLGK